MRRTVFASLAPNGVVDGGHRLLLQVDGDLETLDALLRKLEVPGAGRIVAEAGELVYHSQRRHFHFELEVES